MRKTIHSASTERMVFLLVEALPQTLMNAALWTAAARFCESLKNTALLLTTDLFSSHFRNIMEKNPINRWRKGTT